MSTPSLFYQPKINRIKFSSVIQCVQSDKPKLIALEEARNAYIEQATSARFDPEKKLEAANRYLSLLVSYCAFYDGLRSKNDEELVSTIFKKMPQHEHKSVFNGKPAIFTDPRMENYLVLFQMVATQIDMQFQITQANAAPDVLRQQNQRLKETLGILDELRTLSRDIVVLDQDVLKVAMELRVELIEWVAHVVKGFFCINALDQGIAMNKAAEKNDEPLCFDYQCLAGFAKTAEQCFRAAESELNTTFRQDMRSMNPNFVRFVQTMRLVAQMCKLAAYYRHFYDISVDEQTADSEVEHADNQKYLIGSMMKKLMGETERIRIKSSAIDNWFGERFDTHARTFAQIAERGRDVAAVLADIANLVDVKSIPYERPKPLWTDLNIPNAKACKKPLPAPSTADVGAADAPVAAGGDK